MPLRERPCAHRCGLREVRAFVREADEDARAAPDGSLRTELAWLMEDVICAPGADGAAAGPRPGAFPRWVAELDGDADARRPRDGDAAHFSMRADVASLRALWRRRVGGAGSPPVPMQYLVGCAHFYGADVVVREGVLIPRPETEVLAEMAAREARRGPRGDWADVGTGSGCLAVAVADAMAPAGRPAAGGAARRVYATDVSAAALEVARVNVARAEAGWRGGVEVHLLHGSLLAPVAAALRARGGGAGLLAGIVSNPPYIPSQDIPGLQVRAHARVPPAPDAHRAVPPRAIRRRPPAPPRGR